MDFIENIQFETLNQMKYNAWQEKLIILFFNRIIFILYIFLKCIKLKTKFTTISTMNE